MMRSQEVWHRRSCDCTAFLDCGDGNHRESFRPFTFKRSIMSPWHLRVHNVFIAVCILLMLSACVPIPTSRPVVVTPGTAASAPQSLVASVEAASALSVRFTLAHPDPAFLQKLAFSAFGPGSPANIRQYNGGGDLIRNPVGTGPFRFAKWADGDYITLERNEDYWGEKPALKTLTYRVIKEPASRFLELRAGTVDGVDNLAPDDIAAAQADPNLAVYTRPPFNIGFLGINRSHKPFDDSARAAGGGAGDQQAGVGQGVLPAHRGRGVAVRAAEHHRP